MSGLDAVGKVKKENPMDGTDYNQYPAAQQGANYMGNLNIGALLNGSASSAPTQESSAVRG